MNRHYMVADLKLTDASALLDHNAGKFVAKRTRHGYDRVPPYERLKVGSAGQGRLYLYKQFPLAGFRDSSFMQLYFARSC